MAARTLYDKIWADHLVERAGPDGTCLIYVNRRLVRGVTDPQAFEGLRLAGRKLHAPEKTLLVVNHKHPHHRSHQTQSGPGERRADRLSGREKRQTVRAGIFRRIRQAPGHRPHHRAGAGLYRLPGTTIVCGDSHTATHGAFGALAYGIGTSEVEHVLATQTLYQKRSKNMRAVVNGKLPAGVTAKDIILAIIGEIEHAGGTGYALEYAGEAISALSMEGRMTVCNMSVEAGAKAGFIAPDDKVYAYLKDRPKAPKGAAWDAARRYWDTLTSDDGAEFDREIRLDAARLPPLVTWGTSRSRSSPSPGACRCRPRSPTTTSASQRKRAGLYGPQRRREDLRYRHRPGVHRLLHQRPDRGFARRRRRRDGKRSCRVTPWWCRVPASSRRRPRPKGWTSVPRRRLRMARARLLHVPRHEPRQARARRTLRLDLEPQFRGPAGLKGRTHLMSPAMAAAAAIAGHFVDVRKWG